MGLVLCGNPTALNVTLRFLCVCVLLTAFLHCDCFKMTCLYIPVFPSVHIVNFSFLNQEFMEVSVTLLQISSQPSNVNNGYDSRNTSQPFIVLGNLNHGCLNSPTGKQKGLSLHCSKSLVFHEN